MDKGKGCYGEAAARERLSRTLPYWRVEGGCLVREYRTEGWKASLMVVNAVGHLAEAAWHHPGLEVSWDRVRVSLSTHDAGGITDKDFELALQMEAFVQWQPGRAGGALQGTPQEPRYRYIRYDA